MESRVAQSTIFSQYTMFSILIPGLFSFAIMIPFAPPQLFTQRVAWAVVFLIAFSFVVGAVSHILSESFSKSIPFLNYASDLFVDIVTDEYVSSESRDLTDNEKELLDTCLKKIRYQYNIEANSFNEQNKDSQIGIIYQIMINKTWKERGPLRLLFNIRMMSRSLVVISLLMIPVVFLLSGSSMLGYLNYSPLYHPHIPHIPFMFAYSGILVIIGLGFVVGQKKFATYVVFYMLASYADIETV